MSFRSQDSAAEIAWVVFVGLLWFIAIPIWFSESVGFLRGDEPATPLDFSGLIPIFVAWNLVWTAAAWRFLSTREAIRPSRLRLIAFTGMIALPAGLAIPPTLHGRFEYLGPLGLAGILPFLYAVGAPRPTFAVMLRLASVAVSLAFLIPSVANMLSYEVVDHFAMPVSFYLEGIATNLSGCALTTGLVFVLTRRVGQALGVT